MDMPGVLAQVGKKHSAIAILLLILAGGALLRFFALSAESFWFDEAYSVWVAQHSVGWHIELSTQRIFPPLYYLLLHFWLPLGRTECIVRSLSVLVGLGSVGAIYALAKQLFGVRAGLISALLLTISPLHIWYSQEARMYILVAALGLCSAYYMWLALQEGKLWDWLAYVLSTAMAMNTHYFAIFFVPFQNAYVLYLLLRRHRHPGLWKHWLVSQVAIGLLSVIGLAGIFSSESTYWWGLLDTWHGAPTWRDLVALMFSFSLGTTARGSLFYWGGLLLFGFCVACSFFVWNRRRPTLSLDDGLVFSLLYLIIPLGTVFLLSQFQSFWVLRYIFPFLPPYCIIVACGIARAPGGILKPLLVGAIVLVSALPVANTYRYEQKENWRAAVQYITAEEQPSDLIFLVDEDIWLPFEHYYDGSARRVGVSRVVTDRDLLAARVGMLLSDHARIWLVLSHTDNLTLKDCLMASRYTQVLSEKHFTGVEVDLFAVRSD
jgi:mannosyltransferase